MTENELFIIIKIAVASTAVSPYLIPLFCLKRLSLLVLIYCYMYANFYNRNRWLHSILQLVELCRSTENLVTDVSWHTN